MKAFALVLVVLTAACTPVPGEPPEAPVACAGWVPSVGGVLAPSECLGPFKGAVLEGHLDIDGDGRSELIVAVGHERLLLGSSLRAAGMWPAGDVDGADGDELFVLRDDALSLVSGTDEIWQSAWTGLAPAAAGDVDGDGYGDVFVERGRVHHGPDLLRSTELPGLEPWVMLGDVDGDGFDELGTQGEDDQPVRWISWEDNAFVEGHHLEVDGDPVPVGDIDGDDLVDLVIHDRSPSEGRDEHWLSAHYGIYTGPEWWGEAVLDPRRPSEVPGITGGDVNGDGYSDVLIQGGPAFADRARLLLGAPAGLSRTGSWEARGFDVRLIGDRDGDGLVDAATTVSRPDGAWIVVFAGRACPDDLDCDGVPNTEDCGVFEGFARAGVAEVCDDQDNDCDGVIDEDDDQDGDGWATCAGDCDDLDPARRPQAPETCNGVDDDCDGWIDESEHGWFDGDADGVPAGCDVDDTDPERS